MQHLILIVYIVLLVIVFKMGDPARATRRLAIFSLLLLALIFLFRHPLTRWSLNHFEYPVQEITSGNEFTIKTGVRVHRIRLAKTELPVKPEFQARAKDFLAEQIGGKKVRLELADPNVNGSGPFPAIVRVGDLVLNNFMVDSGYLIGEPATLVAPETTEKPPPPPEDADKKDAPVALNRTEAEPQAERSPSRSLILRMLSWGLLGAFGSAGLGMILTGSRFGWVSFLGVVGGAVWGLVTSWQEGISLWPPIFCLTVVFLLAGTATKACRMLQEQKD